MQRALPADFARETGR